MNGFPAMYCATCNALRAIEDWRERGEALVITLDPCGHLIHRSAGVEWRVRQQAA